jgi:hypothetical protein
MNSVSLCAQGVCAGFVSVGLSTPENPGFEYRRAARYTEFARSCSLPRVEREGVFRGPLTLPVEGDAIEQE